MSRYSLKKLPPLCEANRRTYSSCIAMGKKTSVYTDTEGARPFASDPNEKLKVQLSSCRLYLASVTFCVLISSTNCEFNIRTVVIQY